LINRVPRKQKGKQRIMLMG